MPKYIFCTGSGEFGHDGCFRHWAYLARASPPIQKLDPYLQRRSRHDEPLPTRRVRHRRRAETDDLAITSGSSTRIWTHLQRHDRQIYAEVIKERRGITCGTIQVIPTSPTRRAIGLVGQEPPPGGHCEVGGTVGTRASRFSKPCASCAPTSGATRRCTSM